MSLLRYISRRRCFLTNRITSLTPTSSYTTKAGDENWNQIYRFPQIRLLAAFNKLKIYQGSLSALAIPLTLALEQSGNIAQSTSYVVAAVGVSGLATLCIGSLACRNVVGLLYVNDGGTKLKISCPDFWGNRKDKEIEINDMIPSSNLTKFKYNPAKIITTGNSENYRLLESFGEIIEPDFYFSLFGK